MNIFDGRVDEELKTKSKEELIQLVKDVIGRMYILTVATEKLEGCVRYCFEHTMDADEKDIEGLATCHDVFRKCRITLEDIGKWSGLHGPQEQSQ